MNVSYTYSIHSVTKDTDSVVAEASRIIQTEIERMFAAGVLEIKVEASAPTAGIRYRSNFVREEQQTAEVCQT